MGAYAVAAGSGANQQQSGAGGASVLGTFSQGLFTTAANSGSPGTGYGKGGNGAVLVPSQPAQGGGAGAQGIIIIREYN